MYQRVDGKEHPQIVSDWALKIVESSTRVVRLLPSKKGYWGYWAGFVEGIYVVFCSTESVGITCNACVRRKVFFCLFVEMDGVTEAALWRAFQQVGYLNGDNPGLWVSPALALRGTRSEITKFYLFSVEDPLIAYVMHASCHVYNIYIISIMYTYTHNIFIILHILLSLQTVIPHCSKELEIIKKIKNGRKRKNIV